MRPPYFPPSMCSACFGQYPDRNHVDFEAAWDGPVVNNDGTPYSVDELVLCENCIRAAVAMLPPTGEEAAKDERIAELEARYEETLEFALRLQNGITNLQDALDAKLAPIVEAAPPKARRRPPVKAA